MSRTVRRKDCDWYVKRNIEELENKFIQVEGDHSSISYWSTLSINKSLKFWKGFNRDRQKLSKKDSWKREGVDKKRKCNKLEMINEIKDFKNNCNNLNDWNILYYTIGFCCGECEYYNSHEFYIDTNYEKYKDYLGNYSKNLLIEEVDQLKEIKQVLKYTL